VFRGVLQLLTKLGQCPFLKRYLRRDEIAFDISSCDAALNNALGMFRVRFPLHSGAIRADLVAPWQLLIQIRMLKLIQANELWQQQKAQDLLESLSHLPDLPVVPLTLPSGTLPSPPTDPESVQRTL
jgi:abelson tyrosine-protein kinase 1